MRWVNIWDINHFMAKRMSALWSETTGAPGPAVLDDADKGVWAL